MAYSLTQPNERQHRESQRELCRARGSQVELEKLEIAIEGDREGRLERDWREAYHRLISYGIQPNKRQLRESQRELHRAKQSQRSQGLPSLFLNFSAAANIYGSIFLTIKNIFIENCWDSSLREGFNRNKKKICEFSQHLSGPPAKF